MKQDRQLLRPKDSFFVRLTELVSEVDLNVLSTLYRPLLGIKSFGLYHTLLMMTPNYPYESLETYHYDLFSEADMGIQEFLEARKKLEALGLLRVFVKSEEASQTYLYQLEKPLSYQAFLKDDMLTIMLLDRVGQRRFERLIQELPQTAKIPENYQEVTSQFVEVYHPSLVGVAAKPESVTVIQESVSQSIPPSLIDNQSFNWDYFEELMKGYELAANHLNRVKNELLAIHQQYGFDELTLKNYLANFVNYTTNELELKKFKYALVNRKPAQQQIKPEGDSSLAKQDRQQPVTLMAKVSKQEQYLINLSNDYAPMSFLETLKTQKKGSVVITERWAIEKLVKQSGLPNNVLNILIHYILVVQNKTTFEEILAFKIANDWSQSGVKTPLDAIERTKKTAKEKELHANQASKYVNKKYPNKTVRKETLPDWVNKENKETKMSEEEANFFKEQLRKMRESENEGDK